MWVKECKNLPITRGVAIDPFVKWYVLLFYWIYLYICWIIKCGMPITCEFGLFSAVLPDTSRKSRQKTRVLKRASNPVFNHTMVYDGFSQEDLKEACVELTVWDHDRLNNHFIGGIRLGPGTGEREITTQTLQNNYNYTYTSVKLSQLIVSIIAGKSYGTEVNWMDSNVAEAALWERMMQSPNEWVEDILPLRMMVMARMSR